MKKQWVALLLVAILLVAAMIGCAAAKSESPSEAAMPAPAAPAPEMPAYDGADRDAQEAGQAGWDNGSTSSAGGAVKGGEASPNYGGHKIIKTASLGLETREFDSDFAYIKQKIVDMGGYVASSYVSGRKPSSYNEPGRYASLSLRLPQDRLETFLTDAKGIATVTYENNSGEDITSSYFDTQSRLEIYEVQRDHIKELLNNPATPLEDRILVEQELFRLTYEIENLTTQLARWDDLVDFSTVTVELNEIPPAMAVASNDDFGTRISEGLQNTFSGMAVFFENLVVFLIVASPVLVIVAIIVVIILVLVRRGRKKRLQAMANRPSYAVPTVQPEQKNNQPE